MLTFLNSAILFGLAAVSIPILIHLFTRRKNKVIYFSSLKFLKELQRQQIRRLKIRQILLLILRSLLVLFLVLAFARPTRKSTESSSLESGAQLTAVIILDNTMSMGRVSEGRLLLERAKDSALEVVSMLRPGDEVYLLYPQNPPHFVHETARYNLSSVRELIENTAISYAATDYVSTLLVANNIMKNSNNINKEIYLISDMQKNGLETENLDHGIKLLAENVKLFVLPSRDSGYDNLTVASLSIGNQILEQGKVAEVEVRIRNFGQDKVTNKLVHLFVNGKRIAQDVVDIPALSATNLLFRIVPQKTGFQSGYIVLEDDILAEDNRRYFAFHLADRIPVLLIGNNAEDTRHLKLALRPQKDVASYIEITEITIEQLHGTDLDNFAVVALANVPKFSSAEVLKLQTLVKAGGGLLVFLGDNVDLRNYNEYLHKKLQLPSITRTINPEGGNQYLSLEKIDFSHPIFRGMFEDEKIVETPHVSFAVEIDSRRPVDRIIEYSNGAPFLFESNLQNGRILYVTTGLAQKWSDIIFKGFFVPLINRTVFYLAGAASGENQQVGIGTELTFSANSNAAGADLMMEKPDGNRVKIKPEISRGHYLVRFNETNLPGIYRLYDGDKLVGQWACNYDPAESDGAKFELEDLQKWIYKNQIIEIEDQNEIAVSLQQSRFGREYWKVCVMLAFLLLVTETVLARSKTFVESEQPEA